MGFLKSIFGQLGRPDVEVLKANGDIDGLIKALSFKRDESIPRAAAEALKSMGDQVLEPLVAAAKRTSDTTIQDRMMRLLASLRWKPEKSEFGARFKIKKPPLGFTSGNRRSSGHTLARAFRHAAVWIP